MELIELDLTLPDVFYEVEKRLKTIHLGENFDFVIAGGSLSNFYMNKPIKDIDIFIHIKDYDFSSKEKVEEALMDVFKNDHVILETKEVSGYREWITIPSLYRIQFMGYILEFIPCTLERVYDFDIRFRQFYFYKGKLFASRGALEDIEKKQLTVVSPSSPASTLSRLFRFEEQFGFLIHPKSIDYVLSYCHDRYYYDYFVNYIENNASITPYSKKKMEELLNRASFVLKNGSKVIQFEHAEFPYDQEVKEILFKTFCDQDEEIYRGFGLFFEALENSTRKKLEPIELPMEFSDIQEYMEPFAEKVNALVKKYRLRCLTSGYPLSFKGIPMEELSERYSEFFQNESLHSFVEYLELHYPTELSFLESSLLRYAKVIHEKFSIRFEPLSDGKTSIGDVLTGNYCMMIVNDIWHYRMRLCTNGKFTIGGLPNVNTSYGGEFFLKKIGELLKKHDPEIFDFNNQELEGIFSYGSFENGEHFFPDTDEAAITFLENQRREMYRNIVLK